MSNFESFYKILNESGMDEVIITFGNLHAIFGELPKESAYRNWWINDGSNEFSKTWCDAGYNVTKVVPGVHVCFTSIAKIKADSQPIDNSNNAEFLRKVEKKDQKGDSKIFGVILLVLDLVICLPALIACVKAVDFASTLALIIIGGVIFFASLIIIFPSSGRGYHYSATYDDVLREVQSHNSRVEQMMKESEYRRVREESQKISNEMHQDLADMFDGRLTNIFRNPWKGIL